MLLQAKAKMNSSKNVKRYLIKIIVKHFFYPKIYVGEKVSSQNRRRGEMSYGEEPRP